MTYSPAPKPSPREKRKPKPLPKLSPKALSRRQSSGISVGAPTAKRSGPIKHKKRTPDEDLRIYGPRAFRDFLHQHPCLGCGTRENIQQAHRFTGGMGRKGRWQDTLPLCGPRLTTGGFSIMVRGCHAAFDAAKQTWSREHNLPGRAAWFWERWQKHNAASEGR
jgi:hypothetical protein